MTLLSSERLDDRRMGLKKINELKEGKSKTLIIHYVTLPIFGLASGRLFKYKNSCCY